MWTSGLGLVAREPGPVLKVALPLCGGRAAYRPEWVEWVEMEGDKNEKKVSPLSQNQNGRFLRNSLAQVTAWRPDP